MTAIPTPLADALSDRYDIERELGRGGMATVYLARDRRHGREVAIKVLDVPSGGGTLDTQRFLREIQISAGLVHPGIVPVHDSGEHGGFLYFVMPYVAGETLAGRLRTEKRLGIDIALRYTRILARALAYAHRQGIVHRDIKPANIFLLEGEAVLADFGIARSLAACGGGEALTSRGLAIGTPQYMSPEQVAGDSDLDGRSDQYSLACVLYEMLAGEPPFSAPTTRALLTRHLTAPIPSVRALRPEVPAHVDAAIARALAKDPSDRFESIIAFADALGMGSTTTVTPLVPRLADRSRSIAVLPFVTLGGESDAEYLGDGITEELISVLTQIDGLRVASRTSVFAYKGRAEDVRTIGAQLGVTWVLEGSVRQSGRRIKVTARLTDVAEGRHLRSLRFDREFHDVFAIEDEIATSIVSVLRPSLVGTASAVAQRRTTDNTDAYRLYLKGRFAWNKRTPQDIAEAISLFEEAIEADPAFALAYTGLADAHALHVDYGAIPVVEGLERAEKYARQALALDERLAEAHTSLGWVLFIYKWQWQAALDEFRRAIELNPNYATAHQWAAFPLVTKARFDEAIAEALTALELDPASVSIRRSVGWAFYYARRYNDALEHLERAVMMNPTSEESHRAAGLAHLMNKSPADAELAFHEALVNAEGSAYALAGLGVARLHQGDEAQAREILETLNQRAQMRYVSPVAFVVLHAQLGEHELAIDWLERAHADRRGFLAYLRVNPMLDPLRGNPRFEELAGRLD